MTSKEIRDIAQQDEFQLCSTPGCTNDATYISAPVGGLRSNLDLVFHCEQHRPENLERGIPDGRHESV